LTRLLDLERSAGYQVGQQARMNLGLVPQHGGPAGSIRTRALREVGGWHDDVLAEDTDLTCRLLLSGWSVAYENQAECYEEVPETWPVRIRQLTRWARGHNQALLRHVLPILFQPTLMWRVRLDAALMLGVYAVAPVMMIGILLALMSFYLGAASGAMFGAVGLLCVGAYATLGNAAAFYELAAAVRLDGSRNRIRLLPLNLFVFLVSMVWATRAMWMEITPALRSKSIVWEKTDRFRKAS
jgi:cellulose synthase/poly-beta-1,6-N-acetylglucosamine synthase-like glycosyltransferase